MVNAALNISPSNLKEKVINAAIHKGLNEGMKSMQYINDDEDRMLLEQL